MTGFLRFLAHLPLPILRVIANMVACIMILLPHTGMRWTTRVNLMLAMPELDQDQRLQLERASIQSQCYTAMESLKCWGMPAAYSVGQIRHVEGLDILQAGLADPHGMIAIVPHFGTWEMMNAWLNQYGAPTIMYKAGGNVAMDAFMLQARQRLQATLVPADEHGVRAIFKTLKRGGFTIILPDHVPEPSGGIFAPFFGHSVMSATIVSKLAQKTQCALIGLSCTRSPDGDGFNVLCEALSEEIKQPGIETSVAALNQGVETMIRRAPEQYMWAYRRFKDAADFQGIYRKDEDTIRQIALKQA